MATTEMRVVDGGDLLLEAAWQDKERKLARMELTHPREEVAASFPVEKQTFTMTRGYRSDHRNEVSITRARPCTVVRLDIKYIVVTRSTSTAASDASGGEVDVSSPHDTVTVDEVLQYCREIALYRGPKEKDLLVRWNTDSAASRYGMAVSMLCNHDNHEDDDAVVTHRPTITLLRTVGCGADKQHVYEVKIRIDWPSTLTTGGLPLPKDIPLRVVVRWHGERTFHEASAAAVGDDAVGDDSHSREFTDDGSAPWYVCVRRVQRDQPERTVEFRRVDGVVKAFFAPGIWPFRILRPLAQRCRIVSRTINELLFPAATTSILVDVDLLGLHGRLIHVVVQPTDRRLRVGAATLGITHQGEDHVPTDQKSLRVTTTQVASLNHKPATLFHLPLLHHDFAFRPHGASSGLLQLEVTRTKPGRALATTLEIVYVINMFWLDATANVATATTSSV